MRYRNNNNNNNNSNNNNDIEIGNDSNTGSFENLDVSSLAYLTNQKTKHVSSFTKNNSKSICRRKRNFLSSSFSSLLAFDDDENDDDDDDDDAGNKGTMRRRNRRKYYYLVSLLFFFCCVVACAVFLWNISQTARILSSSATTTTTTSTGISSAALKTTTKVRTMIAANSHENNNKSASKVKPLLVAVNEKDKNEVEEDDKVTVEVEVEEQEEEEEENVTIISSFVPKKRIPLLSAKRMVDLSRLQTIDKDDDDDDDFSYDSISLEEKRSAIATTIKYAYDGYMNVFPADELDALNQKGLEWFHVALTAIDAIDTFAIVGLTEEYEFVKNYVKSGNLKFNAVGRSSVFESTIRIMGAFLAAHHIEEGKEKKIEAAEEDLCFLDKAQELADILKVAFETNTGIPRTDVDFSTGIAHDDERGLNGLAQATTLTLEWECLEHTLEKKKKKKKKKRKEEEKKWTDTAEVIIKKYGDYVRKANEAVHELSSKADFGLLPDKVGVDELKSSGTIKLGANGDSYYEYLLKSWIHRGKPKGGEKEYVRAMDGVFLRLVERTKNHAKDVLGLVYVGEMSYPSSSQARFDKKMDHLVCFLPGLLALGHLHGVGKEWGASASTDEERMEFRAKIKSLQLINEEEEEGAHLQLAKELMRTCVEMYERMPLGLHPEIAKFDQEEDDKNNIKCFGGDLCVSANDAHSILRPETVESLFILHRVTSDDTYRRSGWRFWQAWERLCRVDTSGKGGYASLRSVLDPVPGTKQGKQQSFFLSETLKYLFLLFTDDRSVFPLECFVFNTEGHPLPIMREDDEKTAMECVNAHRVH